MSLIHDALRDMDGSRPSGDSSGRVPVVPGGPRLAPAAPRRAWPEWLGGVAAFGAVVVAGVVGWAVFGRSAPPEPFHAVRMSPQQSPAAAQVSTAVTAPVVTSAPAVASVSDPLERPAGSVPAPQAANASVAGSSGAAPAAERAAMTKTHVSGDAAPTPRVRPVSAGGAQGVARRAERKEATMAPTPEPVDDKPVEQRFAEFMVAMNMKDWPAAQAQLYALAKRLPPQATALLRAQGWYDLQRGELAAARQSYQLLLDRLPNDEESALNMASIYSQQGKGDAARDTLARAVQLRPDSVRLRDALRRFTPEVRP